jgi:hypothetical protein
VLDARLGRRARAAVVTGDQDHVGVTLGDACGHRAHAHFGDQLDADARLVVGILEVVDQLGQIFDRIDVVVRGRRNQPHARRRVAHFGDPRVDLGAGQLPTFARLGALRHLDLQFFGVDQVLARHAEAPRRHLLDGAVLGIAPFVGPGVALRVFATFAGVAAPADAVHGDRHRLVRLFADRAVAHGAGLEAFDDGAGRFDLFQRDRLLGVAAVRAARAACQIPTPAG